MSIAKSNEDMKSDIKHAAMALLDDFGIVREGQMTQQLDSQFKAAEGGAMYFLIREALVELVADRTIKTVQYRGGKEKWRTMYALHSVEIARENEPVKQPVTIQQDLQEVESISAIAMASQINWRAKDPNIWETWGNGGVELMVELAIYAKVSALMSTMILAQYDRGYPGTYYYEVDEIFGIYFGLEVSQRTYTPDKAKRMLGEIVYDFVKTDSNLLAVALPIITSMTGFAEEVQAVEEVA